MGLFDFLSGDKRAKEKTSAKTAFERACALEGDSRDKRGLRIRQAVRVRAVIDKIFVEGTSAAAGYDEARMMALASGEKIPELPKASVNTCFKTVNTASGPAMAYLPLDHATGVFAVGLAYQTDKIDKDAAIDAVQEIANQVGDQLGLDQYAIQPITPLEFLLQSDVDIDSPVDDEGEQ
jgi:hypothetical protein|tara:strand:+ start:373 stop:909 length:537 start_codon:yes stop_codon:yes gene_type:complete